MAIIRNTASALRRGKVGNETYYVALNKQVVRVAQNDSNYGETASRTISQQGNRVRWANLVQFYKLSKGWMSKAFENKKSGQSDYNRFMQLNLNTARIYFSKEAVAASACVVDEFTISQGSLRSINITQQTGSWATDIQLGDLTIGTTTTIADFTTAILAANNWAKEGMQVSFVSYQQQTDNLGFPTAICTAYEVTLSTSDTRLLRSFLPEFCSQRTSIGTLGTDNNISIGGFAYILSQTTGGRTLVSTQKLVTNNASFIAEYSSTRMRELAIYSYGLNEASFLDSGSNPVTRAQQPLFITGVNIEGDSHTYVPNGRGPRRSDLADKEVTIVLSAPLPTGASVTSVQFFVDGTLVDSITSPALSTDRKSVVGTYPTTLATIEVTSAVVTTSVGLFNIEFNNIPEIYE